MASALCSSITGGRGNVASGEYSAVGGGVFHEATGFASRVSGGFGNAATASYASVSGGKLNEASAGKLIGQRRAPQLRQWSLHLGQWRTRQRGIRFVRLGEWREIQPGQRLFLFGQRRVLQYRQAAVPPRSVVATTTRPAERPPRSAAETVARLRAWTTGGRGRCSRTIEPSPAVRRGSRRTVPRRIRPGHARRVRLHEREGAPPHPRAHRGGELTRDRRRPGAPPRPHFRSAVRARPRARLGYGVTAARWRRLPSHRDESGTDDGPWIRARRPAWPRSNDAWRPWRRGPGHELRERRPPQVELPERDPLRILILDWDCRGARSVGRGGGAQARGEEAQAARVQRALPGLHGPSSGTAWRTGRRNG